jgi:hypothetical protein
MTYLLITITFAVMRSLYSAAIEAFVTWGLVELIIPSINVGFGYHYLFWFAVGFAVAFSRFWEMFKNN